MSGLALVLVAAAAAVATGATAAPPRGSAAVDCTAVDRQPPRTAGNTGGANLTLGTLTLTGLAHRADPAGFRAFRRSGMYRIPTFASSLNDGPVAVVAQGSGGRATFAFGPSAVPAQAYRFVPCFSSSRTLDSIWKGFVTPRPGCYTFAVASGSVVFRRTVPLGVARHCS